jgi:cysteine-rich repeat protein
MRAGLVVLALAGCSNLLGITGVTRSDAGMGGDAPADAPPNTVIGKSHVTWVTAVGSTDVPRDLSVLPVRALIPDGSQPSGFQVVTGTGKADGTFAITPVPDGMEYTLQIDRNYYVTTQHVIDERYQYPARYNPATASAPTTLSYALDNAVPIVNGPEMVVDQFELDSYSLGYYSGPPGGQNNSTVVQGSYDWMTGFSEYTQGMPLPDATQGDDAWLLQLRPSTLVDSYGRRQRLTTLLSVFELDPLTLSSGGAVTKAGSFTRVATTSVFPITFMRGPYDVGFDAATTPGSELLQLVGCPVSNDAFSGAPLFQVFIEDWSRSSSLTEQVQVSYGDPFPTSWARTFINEYNRVRWIRLPGTTIPKAASGGMIQMLPYTGGTPSLTAGMLPPSNVKIASQSANTGGKVTFDGVAATPMTWNGASGAKQYRVSVYRVTSTGTMTKLTLSGTIATTANQVSIPADLFSGGGEFFAFLVQAVQTPTDYNSGVVVPVGIPLQIATYASAMFRFSSTCGNGVVDSGEECDDGGESATCDVDCTTAMCGDGIRNATAGEQCDTVKDTASCDSDCTLPMCGDGHTNISAGEDCDGGAGCNGSCKNVAVCGNGVVEVGESCDTGGQTATCDNDCTTAYCGDGHLNTAAGEVCDDGNTDDNDGCKNDCSGP